MLQRTTWWIALGAGLVMITSSAALVAAPTADGWSYPWDAWLDNPLPWGFPGYRDRRWGDRRTEYPDAYRGNGYGYAGDTYPGIDGWEGFDAARGYGDYDDRRRRAGESAGRHGYYGDDPSQHVRSDGYYPPQVNDRNDYDRNTPYRENPYPGYGNHASGDVGNRPWGGYPNAGIQGGSNTGTQWGNNTDNQWGSHTGTQGGNNPGTQWGNNTGTQWGNNTGTQWGNNTGTQWGNNTGTQGGNNTGTQWGNNTGTQGGNNTGTQWGNGDRSDGNAWGNGAGRSLPPNSSTTEQRTDGAWGSNPW